MENPLTDKQGLPRFSMIRPEHVRPALEQVLSRNRAELQSLLAATSADDHPAFDAAIPEIEALGEHLHAAWAPVRHLQGVANSAEFREAYNSCLPLITRYQTELAHNESLYNLYQRVASGIEADREDGAARLLELAIRDFRLAGVHLSGASKARFKEIAEELAGLQARFEHNLLDAMAAWSWHTTEPALLEGLPSAVLEQAASRAREEDRDGWLFSLDQPTYLAVLTHAASRELRERFYHAWSTRASDQADFAADCDNSDVMEKILALRHEAAGLVGFASHAEYSLASKMAGSVEEVIEFLHDLARQSRPAARKEMHELAAFAGQALEPWDVPYWSEKLRQQRYSISDEELRRYFPLPRVLAGMFEVIGRLYGIRVTERQGIDTWHTDVRYYQLEDASEAVIGGFYTDLHTRRGKRSGAWMDQCVNRARIDGKLQLPVAHLVCNFAPGQGSRPSLLSYDEVLTLFHEFGHVLHHLLTRIDHPGISGINGVPWDAVELPSQFLESFAWDPEVIPLISGHWESGEPLPPGMLQNLRESRNFQAAMQMVRQLEFALFDIRLHAEYDPARGGRVGELMDEVREAVAVIRPPAWNRMAHGFAHVFAGGYDAGYYSYKWAEVLAADAWEAFEEAGIFDPETARRFRHELLEVGGSRDIGEAYRAFRGRAPEVAALLRQSGILPEAA
ncbi:MAG: M3 family metallopeptidase [Chromatiales bacterium]|nr:M3 family metallopeptidase [Chromatiales bacterium]